MPIDVEDLLRAHAEFLDASAPPVTVAEAQQAAPSTQAVEPHAVEHRFRRWLMVAAVLILVTAGVVALATIGDDRGPVPTDHPATMVPSSVGSVPNSSGPPVASIAPQTGPAPTTASNATTGAPTTSAPIDQLTIDEVRNRQIAALQSIPGFRATSTTQNQATTPEEPAGSRTTEFTILADGSFYAATGPDTWGSFDPATGIVRGAFRDQDGELAFQEIVGQVDAFTPISILVGHDPTSLVSPFAEAEQQTVEETAFNGRPAWEVVTTTTFEGPSGDGIPPLRPDEQVAQTTHIVVDQETGLIVAESLTSTDPTTPDQGSTLANLTITDQIPAAFPGTFPPGAVISRSGDPNAARSISPAEASELFGTAVPLPGGLDNATLRFSEYDGHAVGDNDSTGPSYLNRELTISYGDSFVPTQVWIRATLLADGREISPDGRIVVDGFLCGDLDEDGDCDTYDSATSPDGMTIERGALAGNRATSESGATTLAEGVLTIAIISPDPATAFEIANSFRYPA